jgi:glucosamine--fructose-6-phosphate aminotransferase (isomerizing)
MCGIIAYIGPKQAYPIIINGLRRLEYRGYDSAGVALLNGSLQIYKRQGKVQDLDNYAAPLAPHGQVGIGHTRWATHGAPNNINAHPHVSRSGKIAVIHNGIIENYAVLKEELIKRGYQFHSDTDTEAIPHLIEEVQNRLPGVPLEDAMRIALRFVEGAYAFVVISEDEPHKLVAARKSSPLVIGIGKNEEEFFIASDGVPIIEHTRNVVYLDDYEVAVINMDADKKLAIKNAKENQPKEPFVHELTWNLETLEKGGYEHFMLKEIHEQPNSVAESMRGRLNALDGIIKIGGIENYEQKLINARRIIIVACGTSFYAGLVGEYLIEDLARIPVEVEYASEFRYRNPVIFEDDVVMAISQSGETADTLAAIQLAKSKGATILGICNVVGSSISRETDAGAYTHAGPEIGVASTKAFTAQLTILTLMALRLAHQRGTLTETRYRELLAELEQIPAKIKKTLETEHQIECIADLF